MRVPIQELTDKAVIRDFLAAQRYIYISIMDGEYPYIIPLNYGFTMDEVGALTLYFHASIGGRFYDAVHNNLLQNNSRVAFAVAQMEGLIAPEDPCYWDIVYKSVVGDGSIEVLTANDLKVKALSILMDCFRAKPGYEFGPKMVERTTVYKVTVRDYHMKKSKPGNEDKVTSVGMLP